MHDGEDEFVFALGRSALDSEIENWDEDGCDLGTEVSDDEHDQHDYAASIFDPHRSTTAVFGDAHNARAHNLCAMMPRTTLTMNIATALSSP